MTNKRCRSCAQGMQLSQNSEKLAGPNQSTPGVGDRALGGPIGLGGAEFRLPLLIGVFGRGGRHPQQCDEPGCRGVGASVRRVDCALDSRGNRENGCKTHGPEPATPTAIAGSFLGNAAVLSCRSGGRDRQPEACCKSGRRRASGAAVHAQELQEERSGRHQRQPR